MQDKLTINSTEFAMKTISFSKPKSDGRYYRSIGTSSSISLNNSISDPIPFVPSHAKTHPKSQSLSVIEFSLNANYPKSKAPQQPLHALEPLNISITSMDTDEEPSISCNSPLNTLIPSSISSFKYCNELNSYLVHNADCHQVLNTLNSILSNYKHDIDWKIDYTQKRIDGLVFISNCCVYFIIYVWNEPNKDTRFEFRRTSGDALASAKFWSQIKGLYQQTANPMDIDYESFDFISLDTNLSMAQTNDEKRLSKSELDELTECLMDNDLFVVDELNFLYESMMEHKGIAYDILCHKHLMKELINTSLLNKDVCVSRSVLLILEELAKIEGNQMESTQYKLFENISLLLSHQRGFIRKYSIELLYNLSNHMDSWNMDGISRQRMIDNVKRYATECSDDSFNAMIEKINEKLMM